MKRPKRILVTGGRDYNDKELVWATLDFITIDSGCELPRNGTTIAHGACPTGADLWADHWAIHNYVMIKEYPANWTKYKRVAGPIRNTQMLKEFKPHLVVAFPGNTGTNDCVKKARALGIPVKEIKDESE